MLEATVAKLGDPVRRRLFIDVVGTALTWGGRGEHDDRRNAREQVDVPIGGFSRQMLGDFHADCDSESTTCRVLVFFQIELLDVETPCATVREGCIGILESADAAASLAESRQERAGSASDVDNGPRLEIGDDGRGDSCRAPTGGSFHARLVELGVIRSNRAEGAAP